MSREERLRLLGMMALFFLVVCAVGILRPIKNAMALDGLGETEFYQVYLVSAVVVFFVPMYNWLADRVDHRRLITGVGLFFAANLVLFRALYSEGSTAFGLAFYGWYDLFAAALVTQFFLAAQLFFDARMAKRAYPVVIAGGSIGATLGGAITGFFAVRIGTPNLLLVAAGLLAVFALALPLAWGSGGESRPKRPPARPGLGVGRHLLADLRELAASRHVRMIAGLVLVTVLAKQLVDYQFNTATGLAFHDLDAISAFQGKFNAATQWLPLLVLAGLPSLLRRWGVAAAVLLLPAAVLVTGTAMAVVPGLWMAVMAKGTETSLRYSAERAGREILYVPVAETLKFKAKTAIDIALEKGIGKVASALLIFLLLRVMPFERIGWVTAGLAALWLAMALAARREYVRTLEDSLEGRFASLRGVFASLFDATSLPVVRRALSGPDPRQAAFALDLLAEAEGADTQPLVGELQELAGHPHPELRRRALDLLAQLPEAAGVAVARARLRDPDGTVREAAVRGCFAGCAETGDGAVALVEEFLDAPEAAVRVATLRCLARGELPARALAAARIRLGRVAASDGDRGAATRVEAALAAGIAGLERAVATLPPLLADPDPTVVAAALESAGRLDLLELHPGMIAALAHRPTRAAAIDALARQGEAVLPALTTALLDPDRDRATRLAIPAVLARIAATATVEALVEAALAPATDQLLDFRAVKALSRLRARHRELAFDPALCLRLAEREAAVAARYRSAYAALLARPKGTPEEQLEGTAEGMLARALAEAWEERRETTLRALGLVHDADAMHRCHRTLAGGGRMARANALEWCEHTLGYEDFQRFRPALEPLAAQLGRPEPLTPLLEILAEDEDSWVARCASRMRAGAAVPAIGGNGLAVETPGAHVAPGAAAHLDGENGMDIIEKVFLLQGVDVLREARSGHLAMLASIAEVTDVSAGTVLLRAGEPAEALYVVVHGTVELLGAGESLRAEDGAAIGTWSLIDEAPSPVEARAVAPSRLLRVTREDFHELVSDNPELAIGLLRGLARRMRALVG